MADALLPESTVAVIGAGAMGAGIAQIAAASGHRVKLYDSNINTCKTAVEKIRNQYSTLVKKGRMSTAAAEAASKRLFSTVELTEIADASLVIEAIVENLKVKQDLFVKLESIINPSCILATNTSSISVTAIASALSSPKRFLGMHFFNPAPLMELVEVVSGLLTDQVVAETVFNTALSWGKTPVHTKSNPGFIVNRVARPYYAEALRLIHEGSSEPQTLDAVLKNSGGFRMGPFELMDLIGHDVNFSVTKSVWNAYYCDPRFTPSLVQEELINAGLLGRKSGQGFYSYAPDAQVLHPKFAESKAIQGPVSINSSSLIASRLSCGLLEKGVDFRVLELGDGSLLKVGDTSVYMTDGRTATRRAADQASNSVVLIDLAIDYSTVQTLAVCSSLQANLVEVNSIIGVFQAAGIRVAVIKDTPAMVVMRTVAMLINEAADAVNQGVADVRSVDQAMCKGVNYPKGPLKWADSIGLSYVHRVLSNLAEQYGEDRYRISPLISQFMFAEKGFYE